MILQLAQEESVYTYMFQYNLCIGMTALENGRKTVFENIFA